MFIPSIVTVGQSDEQLQRVDTENGSSTTTNCPACQEGTRVKNYKIVQILVFTARNLMISESMRQTCRF
jgi:hypothetical protein